jgi:hypothetical protein
MSAIRSPWGGKRNLEYAVWLEFEWHELMPRDLTHGRHNSFVECSLADQSIRMNCRGGNFHDHMSAQDLKVFCTHCPTMARTGIRQRKASRGSCESCQPRHFVSDRVQIVGPRSKRRHLPEPFPSWVNTSRAACLAATAEVPQVPAVTTRGSQLTLRCHNRKCDRLFDHLVGAGEQCGVMIGLSRPKAKATWARMPSRLSPQARRANRVTLDRSSAGGP